MRDLVAGLLALLLLVVAASLATTLQYYRRRRQRAHDSERALGRAVIAELPTAEELVLFSEDAKRFYYGERAIDKDLIEAVHVLINGAPIATVRARRDAVSGDAGRAGSDAGRAGSDAGRAALSGPPPPPPVMEDRPEGIARDKWDVAIDTVTGTVIVECGAIRERVSQELARAVFDAVRRALETP